MEWRTTVVATVALLAITHLGAAAALGQTTTETAAPQGDGPAAEPSTLSSCAVLDEPGTYRLATNLSVNETTTATDGLLVANATGGDAANATGTGAANATGGDVGTATDATANASDGAGEFRVGNRSGAACIAIAAGNVTLDGGGHVLAGPVDPNATAANATDRPVTVGVAVVSPEANATGEGATTGNVTLQNISVENFDVGVYAERSPAPRFRNVTLANNAGGAVRVGAPTATGGTTAATPGAGSGTPATPDEFEETPGGAA